MNTESASLRAVAFIDGQNLFRSAKEAFGHTYPNYDPMSLAQAVCTREGWNLRQVRFYTGYPDSEDNPFWNHFWTAKFAQMGRQGIHVFSRTLRYRNETIIQPDGREATVLVGREKGIDVRLALDILLLGFRSEYDVPLCSARIRTFPRLPTRFAFWRNLRIAGSRSSQLFPRAPHQKIAEGSTAPTGFGSTALSTTPALIHATTALKKPLSNPEP